MPQNPSNRATDLRGAAGLTIDAISGVVDMVESLHQTISSSAGVFDAPREARTRGVTGLVYGNIRMVTWLVGEAIDAPLNRLGSLLGEQDSTPGREDALGALNCIVGDHLAASDNPLAIPMQLRRGGQPLNDEALAEAIRQGDGRLAIMVHGAFMNDLGWSRNGHDHGAALARDLGIEPLYLHYNSGRHISENGREFSDLLERLFDRAPRSVELVFIAYSMGGLVARSACYYGKQAGHTWPDRLQKILFLGTPHHGAPLEKGGNWINLLMDLSPYSAPFARLGKIRSAGITDLRYGNVCDDDWQGRDRFAYGGDQRTPVPLPQGVDCYAVAATRSGASRKPCDELIGDGLVPLNSALGRHKKADRQLFFPQEQQWIGREMNHLDLLDHPHVYETIKTWLNSGGNYGQEKGRNP